MNVYSISQVQEILGLPRYKINYHIERHKIPISRQKFGGQRVFSEDDLNELKNHFSSQGGQK
jgi:DNA-binding transcriptional MerR regulator